MERIVLHIDMDAFFAAVEEHDKPRLRGLPLVVGADPKGGKGRGVVSTANYKAREYGIHSALPISTAWRLSEKAVAQGKPTAVFLDVDMHRYADVSRQIMDYLRTHGGVLEQASVDEAYLQLREQEIRNPNFEIRNKLKAPNSNENEWMHAEEKAKHIKAHIKKEFGLTCSVGIGPNKLVAKIAAGVKKPDGLTVVRSEAVQEFLDPMNVSAIPGIGPKSTTVLEELHVRTIENLRGLSRERLHELFGKWGLGMYDRARGIDESPVLAEYEAKSIGEQETFETDTRDSVLLLAKLKTMCRSVAASVRQEAVSFRTVVITVRFADFETKTRSHTLVEPTNNLATLEGAVLNLFMPFLDTRENPRKKLVRLLGVRVEKLS